MWVEISDKDKQLLYGVARSDSGKAKEIKEIAKLSDDTYSVYRDRLIKKGLVDGKEHGYLRLTLPCFNDYILKKAL